MKRRTLYIFVALLTFGIGVFAWSMNFSGRSCFQRAEQMPPPTEPICAEGAFTVEDQPEAPARLAVAKALCDGSSWDAQLTLANTSNKVIRGYEIANIDTYEYKRAGESTQGVSGDINFQPGDVKRIEVGGGFRDGMSCGTPTGPIRQNLFWITLIEFADGSEWRAAERQR